MPGCWAIADHRGLHSRDYPYSLNYPYSRAHDGDQGREHKQGEYDDEDHAVAEVRVGLHMDLIAGWIASGAGNHGERGTGFVMADQFAHMRWLARMHGLACAAVCGCDVCEHFAPSGRVLDQRDDEIGIKGAKAHAMTEREEFFAALGAKDGGTTTLKTILDLGGENHAGVGGGKTCDERSRVHGFAGDAFAIFCG